MDISVFSLLDILGTLAFSISGASMALKKGFDVFGVFVLAFVTSIGGGTLRDVLIGNTPVEWMSNSIIIITIVLGSLITLLFNSKMNKVNPFLYIFDAAGLGIFTMAGIQKGLEYDFNIFICIALGTINATFGGLIRDMIAAVPPMLLTRKEIYALAGVCGGGLYFILESIHIPQAINIPICILIIFLTRHLTYRYKIILPSYSESEGWTIKRGA